MCIYISIEGDTFTLSHIICNISCLLPVSYRSSKPFLVPVLVLTNLRNTSGPVDIILNGMEDPVSLLIWITECILGPS